METVYPEFDHRRANHIYVWRTACIILFICQIQTFRCRFLSFYLFVCETQCMIQSAMFCYLYIITEYSTSTPCVYIYIHACWYSTPEGSFCLEQILMQAWVSSPQKIFEQISHRIRYNTASTACIVIMTMVADLHKSLNFLLEPFNCLIWWSS